jgi:hypothetical protein
MECESTYLLSLGVLLFASVVLLSLIGISSFAVCLGLIADSFILRPRRKSVVVGVGPLALFLLLVIAEVL